jgi:hypothetical protein
MYQQKTVRTFVGLVLFTISALFVRQITWSRAATNDSNNSSLSANDSSQSLYAAKLLAIAAEYQTWGRVDDEMRWAPELCRMPQVAQARFSKSGDSNGHGQKLYSLFALDRKPYLSLWTDPTQVSLMTRESKSNASKLGIQQALVKESWKPELADNVQPDQHGKLPQIEESKSVGNVSPREGDHFSPYAERDGKIYRAAEKAGLFIMMQLGSKTPDSDDGWIYGTVTADGKKVTAVGLVKSCIECHQNAPHGRIFGIDYHGK